VIHTSAKANENVTKPITSPQYDAIVIFGIRRDEGISHSRDFSSSFSCITRLGNSENRNGDARYRFVDCDCNRRLVMVVLVKYDSTKPIVFQMTKPKKSSLMKFFISALTL
jgi:hypothetical protein